MDNIMELAINGEWDRVIDYFFDKSPVKFDEFMNDYIVNHNNGEYPPPNITDEQLIGLKRLSGKDHRLEYYSKINEDDMTDAEWADFKSCDF